MIDVPVLLFAHERPAVLIARAPAAATLRGPGAPRRLAPGAAVTFAAQGAFVTAAWPGGSARAPRWTYTGPAPWRLGAGANGRAGQGPLALTAAGGALLPVARLQLEPYVAGVVAAELPGDAPRAAGEAQAIAARTYTAARRAPHPAGAPLCDATHCQRWRGLPAGAHPARSAAQATAGRILTWRGRPIEATWSAACGGWRADAGDAFGRAAPSYLGGAPDARPDGRPWHPTPDWTVDADAATLAAALRRAGWLRADEPLTELAVAETGVGHYVRQLRVTGDPPRTVPAPAFWEAVGPSLGWRGIRSLRFTVAPVVSGTWRFTGRGLGHGVGLCQAGARARAAAGHTAAAILAAYFPGTRIGPWYHHPPEGARTR